MSKLVLIRHAQASYMAADYDNLSEFGIGQSESLGQYLDREGISFSKVFMGPLKRHKQTFEHSFSQMNSHSSLDPIVLNGLKEHNGPEAMRLMYDGLDDLYPKVKMWKEEMRKDPSLKRKNSLKIFRLFMADWMDEKVAIDHDEVVPVRQWRAQVKGAMDEIFKSLGSRENVAIYTSGGTIGAVVASALGVDSGRKVANLNDSIRNTSMSHFHYSSQGFNVLSFNEIPHLSKEQITFV